MYAINAEETITIITRMLSVQILLALINVSALQDIPVMVFHVQVRNPGIFYIFFLLQGENAFMMYFDNLAL